MVHVHQKPVSQAKQSRVVLRQSRVALDSAGVNNWG
jgi:hypothetical protein